MATLDDIPRLAFGSGRLTPQRATIARVAAGMSGAFTIEDLREEVRALDPGAAATATVYRAVGAMESSGFLHRVGSRDGAALYARCEADAHHHHIVCEGCGRIAHADCPIVPTPSPSGVSDGFVVLRHEMTLYGYCPACARTRHGA